MPKLPPFLVRNRLLVGGACLATVAGFIAGNHHVDDPGLAAQDITPELVAEVAAAQPDADAWHTGNWVLDFVEPADGEGGSETEIAEYVAGLDALPGVDVVPAGFYSEGEHLYVMRADPERFDALDDELLSHALVEGLEPELYYSLPDEAAAALSDGEADDVEVAKPSRFQPDDPMFKLQWHMEQIEAPEAWVTNKGEGAIVAVIDTGVAWKTASGVNQLPDLAGTKFVAGESFVAGVPEGLDDHAHGSHVAGTIAQTTNNGIGVTGVAWKATIMPLKVLSKEGRGSVPGIANAIRYAADNGAHVINMSLGGPLPSRVLAKAIEYAHSKGVTTVCAAGNEKRGRVGYPAANKHSIAVSATDYSRGLSWYSNFGKDIDVAAPGGDTRYDKNGDGQPDGVLQNTIKIGKPLENDYLWFQGTSMASPHAAGVAGLIVAAGVTNPDEVERVMKETAVHPDNKKRDDRFGAGIVNARAASVKANEGYAPERGGLAGILALMGLGGLGLAGLASRRQKWMGALGFAGGALWASGALGTTPLAYGLASASTGLVGMAAFGSPLLMSAALPLLLTLVLLGVRPARGFLIGMSLGYAALLLHGAVVLPTLVTGLPGGPIIDRLWLGMNALIAFGIARRISRIGK